MTQIFIHGQVEIPAPPEWMIKQALELHANNAVTQATANGWPKSFTERILYHPTGQHTHAFNNGIFLNEDSLEWARQLTPLATDIRYNFTPPGLNHGGAHTDKTRKYTLIYLLDTGGPDHKTVFYREKGHNDIIRDFSVAVNHYDQLEELVSYKLPLHRWTILNALVLHSIENIAEGRNAIQISLSDFPDLPMSDVVYYDN